MLSALFAGLLTIVSVSATGEPYCYKIDGRLIGKNMDGYKCIHYTSDYSNGVQIHNGAFETVYNVGGVPRVELYTDNLMILPGDKCCPPQSFVKEIECYVFPEERGECCRSDTGVEITGLPVPEANCVHDVVDYASYVPSGSELTFPMSPGKLANNHEVEVYASLHPSGCCDCFLYSLPCPPCDE